MDDKKINIIELKQILVEMMTFIHDFCEKEGIKYSLAYGTLLGAVRHKGFIPWDDDIDIMMMRPDYDRFISLFNNNGNSIYSVASYKTDSQFRYTLAKVVDNRTVNSELGYDKYGIGIDLFPIDKVPNDISISRKLFKRHEMYWNIFVIKNMIWDKERALPKNLVMLCLKTMLRSIPFSLLHKSMHKSATKYSFLDKNYSFGCLFAPYGIKNMMPKEVFEGDVFLPFETGRFRCLKHYDKYLHSLYGDYMQLPPVEKRQSHHDIDAYWK